MSNVDFCITSFLRPEGLKNLIDSILKYYPDANIIVALQGVSMDLDLLDYNITVLTLPFDFGLSASRNYLAINSKAEYILLLEDDFVFTGDTKIERMVKVLDDLPGVGIVGGMVKENGQVLNFEHYLKIVDDTLIHVKDDDNYFDFLPDCNDEPFKVKKTGSVLNFCLIRNKVFDDILWDDELKLIEHTDFYLRLAKTDWQVYYTPDVAINTVKINSVEYNKYRKRDIYHKKMMKKWGLKKIIHTNRHFRELKDDKLIYGRVSDQAYNKLINK